ncbi:hypothetical protein SBD_0689 [Streptomyces bottropensis ATCC 25435]|uniref:Uncharacterized protein n=1 Tax=Streptomyces bottropensis ATCC 25435 TaxID=1054862 RepID=M3DM40_9ACTN|nr:hypothetical protein SBD_0689 [Streptomyces bottropensis ATCC 25435]
MPGRPETPVEQGACLLVDGVAAARLGAHHRHHEGAAAPLRGGDQGVARVGGVAVLDADQPGIALDPGTREQPVGVLDAVRPGARRERRGGRGAVSGELRVAQPGPPEHRQVVGGGHLARGVVPVGRDDAGVPGAQGAGLVLHLPGGGLPAAVEGRQDVYGVVAGAEEDPAPQIGDGVRAVLLDTDQAAPGADARQFLALDGVSQARRQPRQHGQGEQGLQCARRRQSAVRVVRGEHVAAAGVGHQPRHRGDVLRCPGRAGPWPHLCPPPEQRRRVLRGLGVRPARPRRTSGLFRVRHGGQGPERTDGREADGDTGKTGDTG